MRIAIIDLGSNTFHILIVDVVEGKFIEVYRKRIFVGLGDGGIDVLKATAIERGLKAASELTDDLTLYKADNVMITGTAALRSAKNAQEFIEPAEAIFKHKIVLIDGGKEANLIFKGVRLLSEMEDNSLIMDIGGGSTEFIIVSKGEMIWAQSYKLGVGVLHSLFGQNDPMTAEDINMCKAHIHTSIGPLIEKLNEYKIHTLIGASGSFEVFESMTGKETFAHQTNEIDMESARQIINKVLKSNNDERQNMPGLPKERVKLIVVAMVLIEALFELINPEKILVTPYALKEGLLASVINGEKI